MGCTPANKKATPGVKTTIRYKPAACCSKLPSRFGLVVPTSSSVHFGSKQNKSSN